MKLTDDSTPTETVGMAYESSMSQKLAHEIMGKNFFGIEDAIKYFGVNPSKQQIATLEEIPFSPEVLITCKNTHILIATFPMSINDIRKLDEQKVLFYSQTWYDKLPFSDYKSELMWILVRKTPVDGSLNKTWNEQRRATPNDEGVTSAKVIVYTMIGHYLSTGVRLFENENIRCHDIDKDGRHVCVGFFGNIGMSIYACGDSDIDTKLGSSATKNQCS